jgi:hypothetical protein
MIRVQVLQAVETFRPSVALRRLSYMLERCHFGLARLFRALMRSLMMIPKRKDTAQGEYQWATIGICETTL